MSRAFTAMLLAGALLPAGVALAQNNGGNNNGGNNQGAAGISIDADGLVLPVFVPARAQALERQRLAAAAPPLDADVSKKSALRKVSLVKLEAAYEAALDAGGEVPEDIKHLAGLQRIDYVFVYPETGDLVIAGPAEGFAPDATGRMLGLESGRPPLRLDDLALALRSMRGRGTVGCSIDPDPDRLAAFNRFVRQNSSATSTGTIAGRFQRMAQILGLQDVSVQGVPDDSHFAAVLVEADFRMKRISMGLEQPGVRGLRSHLSLLREGGNSMQRWWITPLYDALYTSGDGNAWQIEGQRAQLMSQEEWVDAQGNRSAAASTRVTTEAFARIFTEKFPELTSVSPVFAELQNLIDLSLLGALIQKEGLAERIDWPMALFLDESRSTYEKGNAPKHVPTSVNYRQASRRMIVGLVGGGVSIDGADVLRRVPVSPSPDRSLDGTYRQSLPTPEKSTAATVTPRWWWD